MDIYGSLTGSHSETDLKVNMVSSFTVSRAMLTYEGPVPYEESVPGRFGVDTGF